MRTVLNPTRNLLRGWAICGAGALLPVFLVACFPFMADSALGLAILGACGVLASLGVAAILSRALDEAVEKVSFDMEGASREGFSRYVRQTDWGMLGDLAGGFDWVLQEVQGHLQSHRQQALDEKARLMALIHAVPDGFIMANLRGEVLYINAPAVRMLGLPPEEVRGAGPGLYELIRQDQLRASLSRILEGQARHEVIELKVGGPGSGQTRHFTSTASLFTSLEESDLGLMILIRDVTTERELDKMKEDFFHAVAHDLRAPLFGIQGYVRMLEKSAPLGEKEKGYVAQIHEALERLRRLVEDILDIARFESGQPQLEFRPVDPAALLGRVHQRHLAAAVEKGLRLVLVPPAASPAPVQADERLLERAVENLVANAIKFTPKGGEVVLEGLEAEGGAVQYRVSDTGPGVPPDKVALVFEKFRQLDQAGKGAGFGLGLTIAQQVAQAHGGEVRVESRPEGGSVFSLTVPRRKREAAG